MHKSVMEFCKRNINDAKDKKVLEIGAYEVNGTIRWFVENQKPESYIGTDIQKCDHDTDIGQNEHTSRYEPGYDWLGDFYGRTCADLAIPIKELCQYFRPNIFDITICTEVLEHVEDWKNAIYTMQYLTKPTGYIIITTRSPGFPFHEYPIDKWRFTKENMNEIFYGRDRVVEDDPEAPGVFVKTWNKLIIMDGPSLDEIQVQEVQKP